MTELWLPIPDTNGVYEASSLGRIRSIDRHITQPSKWGGEITYFRQGRIVKGRISPNGYEVIHLSVAGQRVAGNVHRYIARVFVEGFHPDLEVNHKNGIKSDNRADNLEWVSRAGNMAHARQTGLLDNEKPMIAVPLDGGNEMHFQSLTSAAAHLGKSRRNIWAAAIGRVPTAYGFQWKFAA